MREKGSWSAEAIEKINVTRWKAQFIKKSIQLEERDDGQTGEDPVANVVVPRDFNIRQEHLEHFGYS